VSLFGVEYTLPYGLSLALGLTILLVFSLEKFDKPYPGNKHLSELLPSNLSPGSSYVKAFLIYFAIICSFFAALCFIASTATGLWEVLFGEGVQKNLAPKAGTSPAAAGAPKSVTTAAAEVPLVLALLLVGLYPKWRQFGEVEAPVRRFAHRLIGIPQGLEELSVEIEATPLSQELEEDDRAAVIRLFLGYRLLEMPNWMRSRLADELELPELAASRGGQSPRLSPEEQAERWSSVLDDLKPQLRVGQKWYRAKRLMERMFQDLKVGKTIADIEARKKYEKLRSDVRKLHDEVSADISEISKEQKNITELIENITDKDDKALSKADRTKVIESLQTLMRKRSDELVAMEDMIDNILGKAHLYVATSVLLKGPKTDHTEIIRWYGLEKPDVEKRTLVDDILLAIIVMVGTLFVFNYVLYHVLSLFNLSDKNPARVALTLTMSALVIYGGAALVAFGWRRKAGHRSVRAYIGLSVLIYVAVFGGLLLWAFASIALSATATATAIRESPSLFFLETDLIVANAVSSFAAVITAVLTARYIEVAERAEMSKRGIVVRALIQGALTGFIMVVAGQIQAPDDKYFLVLSSLNGFVVGFSLGAAVLVLALRRKRISSRRGLSLLLQPAG
jgi:hypothetical protein